MHAWLPCRSGCAQRELRKDGEGRSLSAIRPEEGPHLVQRFHEVLTQRRRIELPVLADHQLLAAEFPLNSEIPSRGRCSSRGAACDAAKVEPLRARVTVPADAGVEVGSVNTKIVGDPSRPKLYDPPPDAAATYCLPPAV